MPKKERLDKLLVDGQWCSTRSQAQGLILAGKVRLKGQVVDKPGTMMAETVLPQLTVEAVAPYVSRGGLKLEKALERFQVEPADRVCLDVGASSGGFTDCLLQRGAQRVYAIDVGYGQLDWRLRQDTRVVTMEKTNIRELSTDAIPEKAGLAVIDVSFISLKKVLPSVVRFLQGPPEPEIIALMKPQFEYRDYLPTGDFKGVVRGEGNHRLILSSVITDVEQGLPSWRVVDVSFSPITGPKGNREFLLYLVGEKHPLAQAVDWDARQPVWEQVVAECYATLESH
jgi:23S rRNA (cytidine1920-2'-O)/16S rRNA (cytidine1409-2'-O)-methyltransferase